MNNIPKYFIEKIKREQPHKWMQVNETLLVSTQPYVLYKLPDGTEVYGNDEKYLIDADCGRGNWIQYFNPKAKEWEKVPCLEKDWVFISSDLKHDCRLEFTSLEYESTNGYIKFDIIQWLHKYVSTSLTLDDDFYYSGVIKVGDREFNIDRVFNDYANVESYTKLYLVFKRENDVYNVTEELKRYFSKKKMPDDIQSIYTKIQNKDMSCEDFELWLRGGQ